MFLPKSLIIGQFTPILKLTLFKLVNKNLVSHMLGGDKKLLRGYNVLLSILKNVKHQNLNKLIIK